MRRSWFALLALAAGCSGADVAPVTGRVTLDGKPLANATVLFQPIGQRRSPGMGSVGRTDADGQFVLRQINPDRPGAVLGEHRIKITTAPTEGSAEGKPGIERLPACYNVQSTLTRTVVAQADNSFNFALTMNPK